MAKVCVGDIYTDVEDKKKAIVFCFDSQSELTAFEKLFSYVSEKDLKAESGKLDNETEQSYDILFTDGHEALVKKKITFKVDGMYDNGKLLMKYDVMETLDGKKCNIIQNLPIVPIKFLDEMILSPKCVAKFKYNKVDTYIGSKEKNCANILSYVVTKMQKSCLKVKGGPMNKYMDELISRPTEGKWTGWTRYHKIMDNGGAVDSSSHKLVISPEKIEVFDEKTVLKQTIAHKNVTWSCNDDGDCSVKDYAVYLTNSKQTTKLEDFNKVINQIKEKWFLQDYNHCFVLEEKDTHLICPLDSSEEYAVRLALAIAVDSKMVDAEANEFLPDKNGTLYKVLFSTDTNIFLKDYDLLVLPDAVKDTAGATVIEYSKIKSLKNIQCGFEFRHISLPNQYHELNPTCCARFFTDENNFICMQQQSKCYLALRHMIQLIRTNCLFAQGSSTTLTNPTPSSPLKPEQSKDNSKEAWSGEVIFQEIDNFKYRGELDIKKGYLAMDANNATFTVNNEKVFSFPLLSLNFLCESPHPCLPGDYVRNQDEFLEKMYDRDWQQATLGKFWQANTGISQNDCMIVVSDDTYYETSLMILTCATAAGQGNSMRQALTDGYNKKVDKLKGKEKEMEFIPPASDNREFPAHLIATIKTTDANTVPSAATKVKVALDGILYKASGEYVFKYTDLLDPEMDQINIQFELDAKKEFPKDMEKNKADPKCCFKAWSLSGSVFYMCMDSGLKCHFDKAILFKTIDSRGKKALSILKSELKRKKLARNAKVDDPFEFGLGPEYKEFPPKFNLDLLNEETFDNSKNGVWEGWVYETALTERNYNKKVTPVWMEIGDGMIVFKTDDDKKPYKKLILHEYNQICADHCLPKDYIKAKMELNSDFDDMMYLQKSIMNVLGQIKNAYVEEGCVVMDFLSPVFQFGHSHIICGVDKIQGEKIRSALDNSYYQSLLEVDIDNDIKRPNWNSDKYFAKIIVNEKVNEGFTQVYLDKYGLVGRKAPLDPKNPQPTSNEVFNVTYSQIEGDNFGTTCAFWYKNMKIKQRNEEMKKEVTDNNCCFRFFTRPDKKKIEICSFHIDNKICIKQAREIMKGLKIGCLNNQKYSTDTENKNDGEKEVQVDIYHSKTIDDSQNGIFNGFVYFSNAIASSQTPKSNPYYIKVHKMSIEIYEDHTKTDHSTLSINLENLQFSCPGRMPCSPEGFKIFAETSPKFMPLISQINTVYGMFKDAYGIAENFEKSCFILETTTVPYIICPYIPENSINIKKSVIQAFILNHTCRRLSSIPDSDPSTDYSITYSAKGTQQDDTVVANAKGVFSKSTKGMVLDYKNIDNDPITNKKCAFWYKELPLKFNFENPECCFAVSVKGTMNTFCVKSDKVCIGSAYRLMKSMWNGCMYGTPSQNIMKPSPDSEVLGEASWKAKLKYLASKKKYDICPSEREIQIFDPKTVHNDYNVDMFNDIAFSMKKTLYKGWFNVYPIDIAVDSAWSVLNYYGELTPEAFKFYENEREKKNPKLVVRPDMLSMSCGKSEGACKPLKFISQLVQQNPNLAFLTSAIQSKLDLFELKKEDGCTVLENMVASIPNYFIICAHIKKIRSHFKPLQDQIDKPSTYSQSREILSAHYGKIIRKIVYDAYLVSRKYVVKESLPDGNEPVSHARITLILNTNEYSKVTISDQGVVSNSALVVKFDDIQHCRVNYNLVYAPEHVMYDKKQSCCMRYMGPSNQEYICIKDLNCEYATYKFARKFNENCSKRKNRKDDVPYNEYNSGSNVGLMNVIKNVFKSELKFTDIKAVNPSQVISTDEFKIKHKTLAVKFLFKVKEILHSINSADILKSKKLNSSQQDTAADDVPSKTIGAITPRYIGENDQYTITAAKNRVTQYKHKTNGETLTAMQNVILVQTKDFSAVIGEKTEYILLIYTDDGQKLLEISKDHVQITNTAANLSPSYKGKINYNIIYY